MEGVESVQFDIEQLPGSEVAVDFQSRFYQKVADVFRGEHDGYTDELIHSPISCRNNAYPSGRSFTVFASYTALANGLSETLHNSSNSALILSGYDLLPNDLPTSMEAVQSAATQQKRSQALLSRYRTVLTRAIRSTQQASVRYYIGLPFAASLSEFTSLEIPQGTLTGAAQHEFIQAALEVLGEQRLCSDPLYLGIVIWAFHDEDSILAQSPINPPAPTLEMIPDFVCT